MIKNPFNSSEIFISNNTIQCINTGSSRRTNNKEKNYFNIKQETFYVKPLKL